MKRNTRRRVVNRAGGIRLEESCIDLALTNDINADCINFGSCHSDHDFLWTKIPFDNIKRKTEKVIMRDYSKLTQNNVARHIKGNIQTALDLETSQLEILEKLAPKRVIIGPDCQPKLRIPELKS